MTQKLSIVILSDREFPTSEAFQEEVYSKILGVRGHNIIFVMQPTTSQDRIEIREWNASKVYLIPATAHSSRGSLSRNEILKLRGQARVFDLLRNEPLDMIQVRNELSSSIIAIRESQRRKIPFVFRCSYYRPEAHFDAWQLGLVKWGFIKSMKWRVDLWLRRWVMQQAALVLAMSEAMRQDLVKQGIPEDKMISLSLGFDTSIRPELVTGKDIRARYNLGDSPTLIYFGSMDRKRRLDFLLRAMKLVVNEVPDAKLLMVGAGHAPSDVESLQGYAAQIGLNDHVIFTGGVPRQDMPHYIAAADVGLSPIVPMSYFMVSSPTKLFETLGMGKPVVATDIPEQRETINRSGAGLCVPYNEEEFAKAVVYLLRNTSQAQRMGARGREYIEKYRSYKRLTDRVEAAYYKLLENHLY